MASPETVDPPAAATRPAKLHGRAFYESIGSPKYIVAPMVDQSEFAWRMLTRSFMSESERPSVLAYSPMFHARLFADSQKYRDSHFQPTKASMLPSADDYTPPPPTAQPPTAAAAAAAATTTTPAATTPQAGDATPYLDGNKTLDRPLFVQFCANDPQALLEAARLVAPYCDAVDLNLGCPQGIARKGHYGAFLQEDQALVHDLIRTLHENLPVPVTAKIRILGTREETLAYARNVLSAGASILTVHGRRREQKGHLTGVADWGYIRYLRENLPPGTVLFANGNVLQHGDLQRCLDATGADGVMSAEGNLSDPALFAAPPAPGHEEREYWRGRDGRGGWRVDAVVRRYLDIMYRYVVGRDPPERRALFVPGDDASWLEEGRNDQHEAQEPARKKRRKDGGGDKQDKQDKPRPARITSATAGPNFVAVQAHLFHLLRHFVTRHTDVRDALARSRLGDLAVYERVLDMVERRVAEGLLEYEATGGESVAREDAGRNGAYAKGSRGKEEDQEGRGEGRGEEEEEEEEEEEMVMVIVDDPDSSVATVRRCKRPWWVAQPIVRPLPKEAMAKGAISLSKKDKQKLAEESLKKREEGEEGEEGEAAAATNEQTVTAAAAAAAAAATTVDEEAKTTTTTTTGQAAEILDRATSFPDSNLVSG